MDSFSPFLRLSRQVSYLVGDAATVAGVFLAVGTLRHVGEIPTFWLLVIMALPFFAALGAKGTGDLLGYWLEIADQSGRPAVTPAVLSSIWGE